ncbi:MAG TPA: hypothetical protein ENN98_01360 [Desulfurivibrio alkaliphilus]|uniref:Uncharacterized protein n=1 Tax=Desulfurivibrio alkaliphilus TaxID=427923 RepID=A0A7C2TJY2_9BACT|nr:hypothetical protein [Desulfurivibrio alkaliphilus]
MKSGSAFANRFGAKVSLAGAGEGLFLVIARLSDPAPRVRARDGQVVMRLNGTKVLARMALKQALALLKDPGISKVGGVQLDMERYQKFLAAQVAGGPPPGPQPPQP